MSAFGTDPNLGHKFLPAHSGSAALGTEEQTTCQHCPRGGDSPSTVCAGPRGSRTPHASVRPRAPDPSRARLNRKPPEQRAAPPRAHLVLAVFADHVTGESSVEWVLRFPVTGRGVRRPWNTERLWIGRPQPLAPASNSPSCLACGSNSL